MNLASTTAITSTLAHPPIDAVILAVLLVIILIDSLRSGTGRAATLSVAFPLTLFFSSVLSHAAIVGPLLAKISAPLMQAGLFGVLFGILFFLVYRIMYGIGSNIATPSTAIVASLATTIISLVVWLQAPALQSIWHLSPFIHAVFGDPYAFWWLISAFLLMAFIRS